MDFKENDNSKQEETIPEIKEPEPIKEEKCEETNKNEEKENSLYCDEDKNDINSTFQPTIFPEPEKEKTEIKAPTFVPTVIKKNSSPKKPEGTLTTPVLGKEQIKKRLQSFSLMKLGIQPMPIKKIIKAPKLLELGEVYNENGEKIKVLSPIKKPASSKKAPDPTEKAKALIDEIEQFKKNVTRTPSNYKHGFFCAAIPPSPPKEKKSDRSESRRKRKKSRREHKSSDLCDTIRDSRHRDRRSPDRDDKKNTEDEKMPEDWKQVKDKEIDFKTISKIKEKTLKITFDKYNKKNKERRRCSDEKRYMRKEDIKLPILFEYPSLPRKQFIAQSANSEEKTKGYPLEIIRFTQKHPPISYAENPNFAKITYKTRRQTLNEVPKERADLMTDFIVNKNRLMEPIKTVISTRNWYPKEYLVESKIIYGNPTISYGLSVLSESYIDEEDDLAEPDNKPLTRSNFKNPTKPKEPEKPTPIEETIPLEIKNKPLEENTELNGIVTSPEKDKTPNTDEYRSNWESDDDQIDIIKNNDKSFSYDNDWEDKLSDYSFKKSDEKKIESVRRSIDTECRNNVYDEKYKKSHKKGDTDKHKNRTDEKSEKRKLSEDKYSSKRQESEDRKTKYEDKKKYDKKDKYELKITKQNSEDRFDRRKSSTDERYDKRCSESEKIDHKKYEDKYERKKHHDNDEKSKILNSEDRQRKKHDEIDDKPKYDKKRNEDNIYDRKNKSTDFDEMRNKYGRNLDNPNIKRDETRHYENEDYRRQDSRKHEDNRAHIEDIRNKRQSLDKYERIRHDSEEFYKHERRRESVETHRNYSRSEHDRSIKHEEGDSKHDRSRRHDESEERKKSDRRKDEDKYDRKHESECHNKFKHDDNEDKNKIDKRKHEETFTVEKKKEDSHKRDGSEHKYEIKKQDNNEDKRSRPVEIKHDLKWEDDIPKSTERYVSVEKRNRSPPKLELELNIPLRRKPVQKEEHKTEISFLNFTHNSSKIEETFTPQKDRSFEELLELKITERKTNYTPETKINQKENENKNAEILIMKAMTHETSNSWSTDEENELKSQHSTRTLDKYKVSPDSSDSDSIKYKKLCEELKQHIEDKKTNKHKKKKDSKKKSVKSREKEKFKNIVKIDYTEYDKILEESYHSEKNIIKPRNIIKIDYSDFDHPLLTTPEKYKKNEADDKIEIPETPKKIREQDTDSLSTDSSQEPHIPSDKIELTNQPTIVPPVAPPNTVVQAEKRKFLVSEYEEFMKAVCFDSSQEIIDSSIIEVSVVEEDSNLDISSILPEPIESPKKTELVKQELKQAKADDNKKDSFIPKEEKATSKEIEIPKIVDSPFHEGTKSDKSSSEKSDTSSSSESSSENSDSSSYNSDSDSSISSKNSQPITIFNIKQEKISDDEATSENRKRRNSDNENDINIHNKIIKKEKIDESEILIKMKVEKVTPVKTVENRQVVNLEEITLPENIPLPSEPTSTSETTQENKSIEENYKFEVTQNEVSTPSSTKKSKSFIPIKLLTPEKRHQANETVPNTDDMPGFGILPVRNEDKTVSSTDHMTQAQKIASLYEGLPTIEINSRKRSSNINLNISPIKKLLLDVPKTNDEDSDEDFTDKFIKHTDITVQKDKQIKEKEDPLPDINTNLRKIEVIEDKQINPKIPEIKEAELPKSNIDDQKYSDREKHSKPHEKSDDKKTPRRNSKERKDRESSERRSDRSRDRSRRESIRERRRSSERRRDARHREYSREREVRNRDSRRSPDRDRRSNRRNRSRERKDRYYNRRDRKHSRSPSPKRHQSSDNKYGSPLRHSSETNFNTMDVTQSPINSPLDGFKRSLADSTISDSELSKRNIHEESIENSPRYPIQSLSIPPRTTDSPSSPKRISLDDRINLVLGLEKEPPKAIDTVCTRGQYDTGHQPNYQEGYPYGRQDFDPYGVCPPDGYGYGNQYVGYPQYQQGRQESNIKVVQVGNVIQVVPTEQPPPPPVQTIIPKSANEMQPKVLQVGNMLQIIPSNIEPVQASPQVETFEKPPLLTESPLSASTSAKTIEQLIMERKAEKEKRRQEREQRRKEKEKKRKEKEKRKALKNKIKTENMIKKALMLETGELDPEADDGIDTENIDIGESRITSLPWPPAPLGTLCLNKTPTKGILVSHGFSKQNLLHNNEVDREVRKIVKFADGICPGEGTSPSGGEELPSPPPPPKKLPKEKRFQKKLKMKNKKKIKVKIIRTQPPVEETSDTEDDLPPPPPPPGSPPPHLWPPRVKPVNNIHPQLPTTIYPPSPFPQTVLYPPAFPPTHSPAPPPASPAIVGNGQGARHHIPVLPMNMAPGPGTHLPGGLHTQVAPPGHHQPHQVNPFHRHHPD